MGNFWLIMSYAAPFIASSLTVLIGWLWMTDKTFDFAIFGTIVFYSIPAYLFLIAPCYALLTLAIQKFQLRVVSTVMLVLILASMQTIIAGSFLHLPLVGYLYLFLVFEIAAILFIVCKGIFRKLT